MTLYRRALIVFLLLLGGLANLSAQSGVAFFKGSWKEVLEASKTQGKLIFVDAYTEWCGPCKAMVRNTFPNETVADYFNKNFISYSFDMEKGEGIAFAQKYQVNAYPTLLWIDPLGEIVHQALGYRAPTELMVDAEKANRPENLLAIYEVQYNAGILDPQVLLNVAMARQLKKTDFQSPAKAYFATQSDKDLLSAANWEAIKLLSSDFNSREIQYLLKARNSFVKQYGEGAVDTKLRETAEKTVRDAGANHDRAVCDAVISGFNKYVKDNGRAAARMDMVYTGTSGDWKGYAEKASIYFEKYPVTDATQLTWAARNVATYVTEPALLEAAAVWARQAVALSPQYEPYLAQAMVYEMLGKNNEATLAANLAIRYAQLNKIDPKEASALLDRLQH